MADITAAPSMARYSLRMRAAQNVPAKVLASAPYADGHALCLGPDEWLLLLPAGSAPPAIEGPHALIDVSDRTVAFVIEGAGAAALLQTGVALDLSVAAFPVGKVTRTLFEGVEIVLWRKGAARFHVEVWRSFAPYLGEALALAAIAPAAPAPPAA